MPPLTSQKMEGFGARCGRVWLEKQNGIVDINGLRIKVTVDKGRMWYPNHISIFEAYSDG